MSVENSIHDNNRGKISTSRTPRSSNLYESLSVDTRLNLRLGVSDRGLSVRRGSVIEWRRRCKFWSRDSFQETGGCSRLRRSVTGRTCGIKFHLRPFNSLRGSRGPTCTTFPTNLLLPTYRTSAPPSRTKGPRRLVTSLRVFLSDCNSHQSLL